jgi:hypothetical protein
VGVRVTAQEVRQAFKGPAREPEHIGHKTAVAVVAIGAVVILELVALHLGIDGIAFGTSTAAIGGIGGWWARTVRR